MLSNAVLKSMYELQSRIGLMYSDQRAMHLSLDRSHVRGSLNTSVSNMISIDCFRVLSVATHQVRAEHSIASTGITMFSSKLWSCSQNWPTMHRGVWMRWWKPIEFTSNESWEIIGSWSADSPSEYIINGVLINRSRQHNYGLLKIRALLLIIHIDIIITIIFISSNSSCKKVKIEITIGEQDNKAELNCTKRCPFKINNT